MIVRGFSLIELIFALLIIGVIVSYAITNLGNSISKSAIIKLKSDLLLINYGIKHTLEKQLLKNESKTLESLDEDNINLFSNILKTPIQSSTKQYTWTKKENNIYSFNFGNEHLDFTYDDNFFTFTCEKTNEICKEVLR